MFTKKTQRGKVANKRTCKTTENATDQTFEYMKYRGLFKKNANQAKTGLQKITFYYTGFSR